MSHFAWNLFSVWRQFFSRRACSHACYDTFTPRRKILGAQFREEQSQIIRRFGRRTDRCAARFGRHTGRHSDRRRNTVNAFRRRLVHPLQELASVRRKALNVPALALGIERVEREARFAAAANATKHNQFVVRNIKVDRLEIVNLNASQLDTSTCQRTSFTGYSSIANSVS